MARRQTTASADQCLWLLMHDHRAMQELFRRFAEPGLEPAARHVVALRACDQIRMHQLLEEEVFYAVLAEKLDDTRELEEGLVEHGVISELAQRVARMAPTDERFDATVTVLGEYLNHHLKEEERDLFPQVKRARIDFGNLLDAMNDFRRRLRAERGYPPREEEAASVLARARHAGR
jgi:hypothetical protein